MREAGSNPRERGWYTESPTGSKEIARSLDIHSVGLLLATMEVAAVLLQTLDQGFRVSALHM